MLKHLALTLLLVSSTTLTALADNQFASTAASGQRHHSSASGSGTRSSSGLSTWQTGPQSSVWHRAAFGQLAGTPQPTRLDSFVKSSGYNDMIYGDESTEGPPPYFDFLPIGAGINSPGLTTGHQSDLSGLDGVRIGVSDSDPTADLMQQQQSAQDAALAAASAAQMAEVNGFQGVVPQSFQQSMMQQSATSGF